MLPTSTTISDLSPPRSGLRIKHSAGAARGGGGGVLIPKRSCVLSEVEITVFPSSACRERGTLGAKWPPPAVLAAGVILGVCEPGNFHLVWK